MAAIRIRHSVLFDRENFEAMRVLAEAHDRTLNGEIRRAISLYVAQHRHADGQINGRPATSPARHAA